MGEPTDHEEGRKEARWQKVGAGIAKWMTVLLVLAIIGGMGFSLYWMVSELVNAPAIGAAVFAAMITVLGSVTSLIYNKRWERQKLIEEAHRESKRAFYTEFIGGWFRMLFHAKLGEPEPTPDEIQRYFLSTTQEAIIWASPEFLNQYSLFRRFSVMAGDSEHPELSKALIVQFETLLRSIREDMGHDDRKLVSGNLLRLFINDFDEAFLAMEDEGDNPG